MFETIEEFFKNHQFTIAALGAVSTFAAVFVSLMVALWSQRRLRTQLKAEVTTATIVHETLDSQNPPTYCTVSITNTGLMPLRVPLSFLRWKLPLKRPWMPLSPLDADGTDPLIPQKRYPVEIAPRTTKQFYVSDIETFRKKHAAIFKGSGLIDRIRYRFIKAIILTDDGRQFRARIAKPLCDELTKLRREQTVKFRS